MKRKRAAVLKANTYQEASNVIKLVDNTPYKKRPRVQIYPKNLSQENYLLKLNDPKIFDVIAENYNAKEIEHMVAEGIIETSPLAYMRGRTFKNAIVIADEMQNTTPSQMKMLLTRLGQGSKMVVTGDLQQADRPSNNGLLEFLKLYNNFENHRYVDICHFTVGDVERHEAVKEILEIYGDS